jgi:hypothetical protein
MGRIAASLVIVATLLVVCPIGAATAQQLPDVVETRDGGMVRGTIVERRSDGSVILIDAAGQIREFPAANVRYAGARVTAPVEAEPTTAPDSTERDGVEVHFTSDPERLSLELVARRAHVRYRGEQGSIIEMQTVCASPCVGLVPEGPQTLAVRLPHGGRYVVRSLRLDLTHPVSLHVRLVTRRALRRGLGFSGLGLAAIGLVTLLGSLDRGGITGALGAGIVLGTVGLGLSFGAMGLKRPRAYFSVLDYPLPAAP